MTNGAGALCTAAQAQFQIACIAHGLGLDQEGLVEIEELEPTWVQGLHALQRVAREAELEDVLVGTRQDIQVTMPAAGAMIPGIASVDTAGHAYSLEAPMQPAKASTVAALCNTWGWNR